VAEVHTIFAASGSKTLTIPASVQVGDLLILVALAWNSSVPSTPSGYASLDSGTGSGTVTCGFVVWTKTAVSGDTGGAATVSATFSSGSVFALLAYRNVGSTVEAKQVSGSDGGTVTAPSVTTTAANSTVVSLFASANNSQGTETLTPPATNRVSLTGSSSFAGFAASDTAQAAAGASVAQTCTVSPNASWVGVTIALQPVSGANMTVDVASGTAMVNASSVAVSTTTSVSITAADATNPRLDLVTVDSAGTVAVVTGTPAAIPAYPAVPANKAVLAVVSVAANASSIVTANITDLRITLALPPTGYGLVASRPSATAAGDRSIWYATDTSPPVPAQVESGTWVPLGAATPVFDFLSAYTLFR